MISSAQARRHAGKVQVGSGIVILAALLLLARTLPVDRWIESMQTWLDGFGAAGIAIFAAIYVVAALLFVPGSALTLAAGALFGLWWGTAAVSIASTTSAALAFLIARYLARDAVEQKAGSSSRFRAIDRAIGEGGWRIVGLLRLSPAIPFSLGNYLYGLTAIPFVPYVVASWVAMLPGTFLYVYLGHLSTEGLSATGGEAGKTPGEWAALVVGLLATIAVTVYVTRLARRELAKETDIEDGAGGEEAEEPEEEGWPWGVTLTALVAVLILGGAVWATLNAGDADLPAPAAGSTR